MCGLPDQLNKLIKSILNMEGAERNTFLGGEEIPQLL